MRAVQLAIDITADSSTRAFDNVGRAALDMADDVGRAATDASTGLSRVGDSADNLDDKAGRATGALGALSSGFELVGAEKYAGALQAAAMATDFASGVGQAFTLVLELESVQRAKAVVQSIAHKGATLATSAATKAAAASQWALNAAMSANPIGLVVAGVVLLVGALVLAYKKSETFRNVVQGAMRLVKAAIDPVLSGVQAVAEWVGDKLTPLWEPFKTAAKKALDLVLSPILLIKEALSWVIDKIENFKMPSFDFPDVPDWIPGAGGASAAGSPLTLSAAGGGPVIVSGGSTTLTVQVDATGATDPTAVARALESSLTAMSARLGRPVLAS